MTLTAKQIRGIRAKRQRDEAARELESRAAYGLVAGADVMAVYEADRSLVECWMTNTGAIYGPGCARRRPRASFAYSADADARCAGCGRAVADCRRRRA